MNDTSNNLITIPSPEKYVLVVITSVQILFGFISNAVVIASITLGQRHNKTPSDIMILNLGCADLLPCLIFLSWLTFQVVQGWHHNEYYFALFLFVIQCSENAVLAVTIDRYIAICYPLRYSSILSPKKNFILIFMTWWIGFINGITYLVSKFLHFEATMALANCILNFVEMAVVFMMYGVIFRHVNRQTRRINLEDFSQSDTQRKRLRKVFLLVKSAKKSLTIALLYLVTFLPLPIYFIVMKWYFECNLEEDIVSVCLISFEIWFRRLNCFTFLNSCINPIIYSLKNIRFRRMFLKMINSLRQGGRQKKCF